MILADSTPSVVTQLTGSGLIGIREGLEAGIVVMVLAAYLVKSNRREALKWLALGAGSAITLTLGMYSIIHWGTSTINGLTAEIIAGVSSLIAVVIVTAMIIWMKTASAHLASDLKSGMSKALEAGPLAIFALSFFSVGREGAETALLMVGYAENTSGSSWPLVGLIAGILLAALAALALYFGAININFKTFFTYTGVALIFIAAGILGYGIRALQTASWLPGKDRLAFDFSAVWDHTSWYGSILSGIFNFRPNPTLFQFSAWLIYITVMLLAFFFVSRSPKKTPSSAAPSTKENT